MYELKKKRFADLLSLFYSGDISKGNEYACEKKLPLELFYRCGQSLREM